MHRNRTIVLPDKGPFGVCSGFVQGPFRFRSGSVQDLFGVSTGSVRVRPGPVRDPRRVRSESHRGLFVARSGSLQVRFPYTVRKIIAIVWMVPIYALESWSSLNLLSYSVS